MADKPDPHTYTHDIIFGVCKGQECFIYKNVPGSNHQVYIRTKDGRAYWEEKANLKKRNE